MSSQRALTAPAPRRYRTVNWVGLGTLYRQQVAEMLQQQLAPIRPHS